jgi:hypothetical protein
VPDDTDADIELLLDPNIEAAPAPDCRCAGARASPCAQRCRRNGRPALDPVVLFKLLLIGYLFGTRSRNATASRARD